MDNIEEGRKIKKIWKNPKKRINPKGHPHTQAFKDRLRARNLIDNPSKKKQKKEKIRRDPIVIKYYRVAKIISDDRFHRRKEDFDEDYRNNLSIAQKKRFERGDRKGFFQKGMIISEQEKEARKLRASKSNRDSSGRFVKQSIPLACFGILCILLFFPLVNAVAPTYSVQVSLRNQSFSIGGFVEMDSGGIFGRVKSPSQFFPIYSENISGQWIICDEIVINGSIYQQNCRLNIVFDREFMLNTSTNETLSIIDKSTQDRYNDCITERASYLSLYQGCEGDRVRLINSDTNLSTCQNSLSSCNTEKSVLQNDKNSLTTEQESNKNKPITYGIIGFLIGGGLLWFYKEKMGKPSSKAPEDDYNTRGSN